MEGGGGVSDRAAQGPLVDLPLALNRQVGSWNRPSIRRNLLFNN